MTTPTPEPVKALLRAILDALEIPQPVDDPSAIEAHARLLEARASDVRITVARLLNRGDLTRAGERLCRWTAERPVTYTPWTLPKTPDGGDDQ